MRVTHNTPDQLIVEETPWFLGIMLVVFILCFVGPGLFILSQGVWEGLLFAGVGGGLGVMALILFVERVQVILDRTEDRLTLRRRSILRYTQVIHALSDLAEAKLQVTRGSKGETMHRAVLVLDRGMSAGEHPIVEAYTNGRGPVRAVEAVNGWLQSTRALYGGRNARA